MNIFMIVLAVLALTFGLNVSAAAQDGTRRDAAADPAATPAQTMAPAARLGERIAAQVPTPQQPPVPLAEAKKRHLAAQERLQNLVEDGLPRSRWTIVEAADNDFQISSQEQHDRARSAVAEAFDARRQLQQVELAELESRVARIKRALQIRDAMRDTLIDQRTDELLERIEERGADSGKRAAPIPERPGATKGAATSPTERRTLETIDAEIGFKEAERNLRTAKRLYDYAKRMSAKGYVSAEEVQEKAADYEVARLKLEREREKLKLFGGATMGRTPATENAAPSRAGDGRDAAKHEARSLQLDVDEAKTILESAEKAYRLILAQFEIGRTDQLTLAEHAEKYKRAQIQLERATLKLDVFRESHPNLPESKRPAADKATPSSGHAAPGADDESLRDDHASGEPPANDSAATPRAKGRGAFIKEEIRNIPVRVQVADYSQVIWSSKGANHPSASEGAPLAAVQIGHFIEPKKAVYATGDVLTMRIVFNNSSEKVAKFRCSSRELVEKLGIDFALRDAAGEKLNWGWGPMHERPVDLEQSNVELNPGGVCHFPPINILVGPAESVGRSHEPRIFAYLDVKPGEAAQLVCKLSGNLAHGNVTLETQPFEFRVEEQVRKSPAGSATPRAPRLPEPPQVKKPAVDDGALDASR